MVSVIICSASVKQRERVCRNIAETIGVEHEFIIHDNTQEDRLGICQAYNNCASKAKYECLCFVHEDVEFLSKGWGRELVLQANKDYTGVIGLAGGRVVTKTPLSWGEIGAPYIRVHIKHKKDWRFWDENPYNESFSEVITLDGVMMFCKKSVWDRIRFNDKVLKGFHCYDTDFSLRAAKYYKNYVCHTIDLMHYSNGNFGKEWFEEIGRIYEPLMASLPMSVDKLSGEEMQKVIEKGDYEYIRRYIIKLKSRKEAIEAIREFRHKYPGSSHSATLYAKFLAHKILWF